jgi:hypothetical protein
MKQKRARAEFKGVTMAYYRMERIKQLAPLIHRANEERMSIPKAAKWLGWSLSALRKWIKILGITWKVRPKRSVFKFDKTNWIADITRMMAEGKTQGQIACILGVGEWNVSRFIKDNGIQRPSRNNLLTNERTKRHD